MSRSMSMLCLSLVLLFAMGCDPRPPAINVNDVLEEAVLANDAVAIQQEICRNPDSLNRTLTVTEYTPLYLAVVNRNDEAAMKLLQLGADPFQASPGIIVGSIQTPAELALLQCRLQLAKEMIEQHVDRIDPDFFNKLTHSIKVSSLCDSSEREQAESWLKAIVSP